MPRSYSGSYVEVVGPYQYSYCKASKGDYKSLGRNLLRGSWIGVAPLSTSKRVLLIGNIFLTLVH